MKRILIVLLVKFMTIVPMFAQEQAKPMTGVPGVQHPMSSIIPDAEYPIDGNPDWLAIGEDQVWTNSKPTDFVFRMDPNSNQVVAAVPVPKPCSGLIIAAGTLWAPSCEENVIYRIDIATNKVVAKVPVGVANTEGGIAFGAGSVWMPSDPKGVISRIDAACSSLPAGIIAPAARSRAALYEPCRKLPANPTIVIIAATGDELSRSRSGTRRNKSRIYVPAAIRANQSSQR